MKILNEQDVKNIKSLLGKIEIKEIGENNVRFKVVGTKEEMDREGDILVIDGIDYKHYLENNPVVFKNHWSYDIENIIGKTDKIYKEGNELIFEGYFDNEGEGAKAAKLYNKGLLNSVSLGFIVKERDPEYSNIFTKSELLEISFVGIGANKMALRKKGLNDEEINEYMKSGFIMEEKSEIKKEKEKNKDEIYEGNTIYFRYKWDNGEVYPSLDESPLMAEIIKVFEEGTELLSYNKIIKSNKENRFLVKQNYIYSEDTNSIFKTDRVSFIQENEIIIEGNTKSKGLLTKISNEKDKNEKKLDKNENINKILNELSVIKNILNNTDSSAEENISSETSKTNKISETSENNKDDEIKILEKVNEEIDLNILKEGLKKIF